MLESEKIALLLLPGMDGTGELLLTNGPADEGPTWAPNSRELLFERLTGIGHSGLFRISIGGGPAQRMAISQDGLDPDWSGVMD